MPDNVTKWLESLVLGQYADAFEQGDIDWEVLPSLDHEILKELGVTSPGHRLKILKSIQALGPGAGTESTPSSAESASSPTSTAERRQLTVMFCDLVGSTPLSQQLDPEELRDVNRAYQDACKFAIERYDGYVARYMGDGVLAYFGYPHAHEDDAERAVHAGRAIVEAMRDIEMTVGQRFEIELAVRVGIATGPVVVGDIVGEHSSQETAVVGETPNLAARLQGVATPNSVVISDSTYALIRRSFECEPMGHQALKGFEQPQLAWRVTREHLAESLFEARAGTTLTSLVGREEEVELLRRRWDRAKNGQGQVVLLSGEPGIGKSRLTEVMREFVADYPLLRYQCSPYHTNSPLHPVISQLERAAAFSADDTPQGKLARLREAVLLSDTKADREIAIFAKLLSIAVEGEREPLFVNSQQQREATLKALIDQLERLCAGQPVLCIFEDLHWIDPSTLELLDRLVERTRALPVLLMATFRPEFTAPWIGAAHTTLVSLNRMNPVDSAVIVDRATHGTQLPRDVIEQIVEKTDGVPLFVEELTRTVLDSQERSGEGTSPQLTIPATLKDSLMARLDNLPGTARDIAQLGAAMGREFSYEVLLGVSGLSEDALGRSLDDLVHSGLLFSHGAIPHSTYTFKHALVQDAAYETLLKSTRQKIHATIASVLEANFPNQKETEPEVLAQHFEQAGDPEAALRYWLKAAEQALDRSANQEALGHARGGLAVLAELPASPEHDKAELDLQFALCLALRAVVGFNAEETKREFVRARALAEEIGDRARVVSSLRGVYNHHFTRGDQKACLTIIEQIRHFVEESKSAEEPGVLYAMGGSTGFFRGDFTAALHNYEKALPIYESTREYDPGFYALNPRTSTLMNMSWILWALGYPEKATSMGREVLRYTRELSQPYVLVVALAWVCGMRTCCGQISEVGSLIAEMNETAVDHNIAVWEDRGAFMQGKLKVAQGDTHAGIAQMQQAMDGIWASEGRVGWTWMACELAIEQIKLGQGPQAGDVLNTAFTVMEENDERNFEAELHRLMGLLCLADDVDGDIAEKHFGRALEVARAQQSKSLELRAATSLARQWHDAGRLDEANAILCPVYDWFKEGFDTSDLREAKALLLHLS